MRFVSCLWNPALVAAAATILATTVSAVERAEADQLVALNSPVAESVTALLDGWRKAEAYAAQHAGCEVFVGCGDSMLPLYRDRTVLVVRSVKLSELCAGMTVVFTGDHGALVAHTLLEKTPTGWRAAGVGNHDPDRTKVGWKNLVGVVVKAYAPALPGRVVALQ